jgi:type IV secretion system protein VirD4
LLTPGEILQLPASDALVLVSGTPPIRARKLAYFRDGNFLSRLLNSPALGAGSLRDLPKARPHDWSGMVARVHPALAAAAGVEIGEEGMHSLREVAPERAPERGDLNLLDERGEGERQEGADVGPALGIEEDPVVEFPGGVHV